MQGAVNVSHEKCLRLVKTIEETFQAEIALLREELKRVVDELAVCKRAIAQGGRVEVTSTLSRVDVPKPKFFKGARNAREIDNFLWGVEQYFKACGITDEAMKLDTATLYLDDTARMWWRRKLGDIGKGTCVISTWTEFKKELKGQFYPVNAEEEARAKLRRLQHEGCIREYVKEFTEVLLEIPDYPDKEAFFAFVDGLQNWAKLEIQRRGAQDLSTAISIAESLIEFKKSDKPKYKDEEGNGKSGGESSHGKESPPRQGMSKGGKEFKSGERPPLKCFLCEGPHRARDCPMKSKLSALREEPREEPQWEDEAKVTSLRLLSAIKAKGEKHEPGRKGRAFVEVKAGAGVTKALIDSGASHNFLKVEEAKRLSIPYKEEHGLMKAVNSEPLKICGVARDVKVSLGGWTGKTDFFVVTMDDYPIVLGMEFLDKVKAVLVPFANTMLITDEGKACTVALQREATNGKSISVMRLIESELEATRTSPG